MSDSFRFIRWFDEIRGEDVPLVGGKNAALGELVRTLSGEGIPVPGGFAVTAAAYTHVVRKGGILEPLRGILQGLDKGRLSDLADRGRRARALFLEQGIPGDLWSEIEAAYGRLCDRYGSDADVAVRSSATAEDLPSASFAGQQETYLNVRGAQALRESCTKCFASLFTDRAISYRVDQGFDHFQVALSIGVMKMVRSDLAASGVIFTLDTETGFRDVVFVTGAYGLGENVVQGAVNPDEFYVFKPTFRKGHRAVLRKTCGGKRIKMVYGRGDSKVLTRNVEVPDEDRRRFCLSDDEVLTLAGYAIRIEEHFSGKAGTPRPMDIEWAKDGITGELFIVQARPETVHSQKEAGVVEAFVLEGSGPVLVRGKSVGERIASGAARIVTDVAVLGAFRAGEVLVADTTTPDWEPVMKTAAAIVTNRGGRTCHAAIVSRELGIPAVIGADGATEQIAEGQIVTVCCGGGGEGTVYDGALPFRVDRTVLEMSERPGTQIMMNLGNPEEAFRLSRLPNDGVGLARMEFIINSEIQIHPMALVHEERVSDPEDRRRIRELTAGYESREDYFVERLAQGVGTIAAAFYPKPVVVRMSDFKSNEYASLIGGKDFEVHEENPMIGFRGASRYYDPRYREGFALECRAMRRVREEMGLTNLILMIPFCRRVDEGERVLAEMAAHGLKRGDQGLEVYMMCEIPNNVMQIEAFSRLFDGFSIGSNDLTQLTLGVDRDSELLAHVFDERDPGVLRMIAMAIQGARARGRHTGICGQAPSDYPEFASFLVAQGIDSISLNPDSVLSTTLRVLELEKKS